MPKNMSEMIEKIWLKCRKCEHKWYPNPNMWKNYKEGEDKLIQCPKCMAATWIPKEVVENIIIAHRETRTITAWGRGPID